MIVSDLVPMPPFSTVGRAALVSYAFALCATELKFADNAFSVDPMIAWLSRSTLSYESRSLPLTSIVQFSSTAISSNARVMDSTAASVVITISICTSVKSPISEYRPAGILCRILPKNWSFLGFILAFAILFRLRQISLSTAPRSFMIWPISIRRLIAISRKYFLFSARELTKRVIITPPNPITPTIPVWKSTATSYQRLSVKAESHSFNIVRSSSILGGFA